MTSSGGRSAEISSVQLTYPNNSPGLGWVRPNPESRVLIPSSHPPLDLLSCTEVAEEVFTITGRDPMIEIAKALQDAALSDEYFVQVGKGGITRLLCTTEKGIEERQGWRWMLAHIIQFRSSLTPELQFPLGIYAAETLPQR